MIWVKAVFPKPIYFTLLVDSTCMNPKEKLETVKAKYKKLMREGVGDLLALKTEVQKLLEEAKSDGALDISEELEEILIDLSFTIEETKCKCHNTKCRC
ncbi:MAG: hypothetical protein RMJ15_05120 [Nitrososphaerota archaeon]|nr:hypothetical protein [Candidatus Bathyarchaeota archaeon]MDW8023099.1 hypothetical protein [Nitrososphaerota archaeon]